MDPKTSRSILDIGGQRINYDHGPNQAARMEWPSGTQASLKFSPEIAGAEHSLVRTGAWALFHLLDAAEMLPTRS